MELYAWEDPEMGPRKIPALDKAMDGLVLVDAATTFAIDTASNTVTMGAGAGGKVCPSLVYTVNTSAS